MPAPPRSIRLRPASLEALVQARGLVAAETLARARVVQAETGERFDSVLTRLGLVSEQALASLIAEASGLPIARSADYPALPLAVERVSERFLREFKAVVLAETDRGFEVALVDPLDPYPARALELALGAQVRLMVARASDRRDRARAALRRPGPRRLRHRRGGRSGRSGAAEGPGQRRPPPSAPSTA